MVKDLQLETGSAILTDIQNMSGNQTFRMQGYWLMASRKKLRYVPVVSKQVNFRKSNKGFVLRKAGMIYIPASSY